MHPTLRAALTEAETVAGHLDAATMAARPQAGKWSIAEILEHLTLAFTFNAAALDKVLASGELRTRKPKLSQLLGQLMVVEMGYFPRVEAPAVTRPGGKVAPDRALEAFRDAITRLDATLDRVERRFGARVPIVNHPILGAFSVYHWRKFHWRHTRHHVKQIKSLLKSLIPYP